MNTSNIFTRLVGKNPENGDEYYLIRKDDDFALVFQRPGGSMPFMHACLCNQRNIGGPGHCATPTSAYEAINAAKPEWYRSGDYQWNRKRYAKNCAATEIFWDLLWLKETTHINLATLVVKE
jgi:hypothetical protein